MIEILNKVTSKLELLFDEVVLHYHEQQPMFDFVVTHKDKKYQKAFFKAPYQSVTDENVFIRGIIFDIIEDIIQ